MIYVSGSNCRGGTLEVIAATMVVIAAAMTMVMLSVASAMVGGGMKSVFVLFTLPCSSLSSPSNICFEHDEPTSSIPVCLLSNELFDDNDDF